MGGVGPLVVVEGDPSANAGLGLRSGFPGVQACPSFRRCQVICRTPWNGVCGNCRSISRTSARFISVPPGGAWWNDDREIDGRRHCAPIYRVERERSILPRLTCLSTA